MKFSQCTSIHSLPKTVQCASRNPATDIYSSHMACSTLTWMKLAGLAPAVQREALAKPLDIVIGTPQKIAQHAEAGNLFYGDVQARHCRQMN